ncbi:SCO family protein, partial [bacterium]|nr:SCO family protein [bacterium]
MEQQAAIRRTIAMVVAFILLVVYGFIWRMSQPVIMNDDQLRANGAIVLTQPRIFSDFELVDHRGETFNIARM